MQKKEEIRKVQTAFHVMKYWGSVTLKSLEHLLDRKVTTAAFKKISLLAGKDWRYQPHRKAFVFTGTITTTILNTGKGE